MDIVVGYFCLSRFAQVAYLLASRPGAVRILIGRADRPAMAEITAGYSPQEAAAGYHDVRNRLQEAAVVAETLVNVGRNAAVQPQDDVQRSRHQIPGGAGRQRQS